VSREETRTLLHSGVCLSVGVNAADPLRLGEQLEAVRSAGVRMLHVDVMDGVYCPQMTGGPDLVKALPDGFVKDVHLMIEEPLSKVQSYVDAGADIITFQLDASRHPHRVLQSLAGGAVVRGVALTPGTPIAVAEPLLDELELLMVLSINPGWGGQHFLPSTAGRLAAARRLIADREIALAVDGGITRDNIAAARDLGVDVIVAGSAVFKGGTPAESAAALLAVTERIEVS
jgi:ribulose-phosphate 3-epimerase